jgi:NRAMP (natural resistance-associated macrophage protein)-like metal ion transporter
VSQEQTPEQKHTVLRSLGLGLITGAADDDCSAIGTFAQAGAQFGYKFLWTAPATFPMMVAVVYLSGKLGQVTGQGLFSVLRRYYPRWFVYPVLVCVVVGNTIEAGADIGGMAAAVGGLVHLPHWLSVLGIGAATLLLQIWGSYGLIRNVFRVLALSLLAYIFSAFMAHPHMGEVMRGTFIPSVKLDRDSLSILVAIIGTSLSAYLYTWQSNEEVEEKVAAGKHKLFQRRGTTVAQLRTSLWDVIFGMLFSNIVMYFTILATAATLFVAGKHKIETAMEAAQSLTPLAGPAAGLLFAVGIIGVGFLAIPVMTTGAAYDVSQSFGWKNGLYRKPAEARKFYLMIAVFTVIAVALNFGGINPMRALVVAGIVQGFSTPPLMLLILFMTNNKSIMGDHVNGKLANICGSLTTLVIFSASVALVILWWRR